MEICDFTLLGFGVCKLIGYPILGIIGLVVIAGSIFMIMEERDYKKK